MEEITKRSIGVLTMVIRQLKALLMKNLQHWVIILIRLCSPIFVTMTPRFTEKQLLDTHLILKKS